MISPTRGLILDAALEALRAGESISLDSAARRSGLTKAGLMHHFRTKEVLMLGLVDLVAERWEECLGAHLDVPVDEATPTSRIRAYVDYALSGDFDETDMVILSDPRLRQPLADRWVEKMQRWLVLPSDLPPELRANLNAARLLADGAWFASSTGVFALTPDERDQVRLVVYNLLEN